MIINKIEKEKKWKMTAKLGQLMSELVWVRRSTQRARYRARGKSVGKKNDVRAKKHRDVLVHQKIDYVKTIFQHAYFFTEWAVFGLSKSLGVLYPFQGKGADRTLRRKPYERRRVATKRSLFMRRCFGRWWIEEVI